MRSSPPSRRGDYTDSEDELPYNHPLRPAPGAPIRSGRATRGRAARSYSGGDDDNDDDLESESGQEDEGAMDVDDEIDELLSDDGDGDDHNRGDGGDGDDDGDGDGDGDGDMTMSKDKGDDQQRDCLWDDCDMVLDNKEALIQHVAQAHSNQGKQPYACLWRTCHRVGQRQASRHALLTHMRSHTGEKPYECPEPGCFRRFTRSDAMNKHVRALHGPGGPKKKGKGTGRQSRGGGGDDEGSVLTTRPLDLDEPSTADKDLARDDDIAEVVLRVHARDRDRIEPATPDEEGAIKYVRERRPGGGRPARGRGRRNSDSGDDAFDEGASARYPQERVLEGYLVDQNDHEVPVMGRCKWQAKYVMAKAKLMLVDEENKMRRDELDFWLKEEERVFGTGAGSTVGTSRRDERRSRHERDER